MAAEIMRGLNMMALTPPSTPLHPSSAVISLVFMSFNPFKFKFPASLMLCLRPSSLFSLSRSVVPAQLNMLFYYYFIGFYYSVCHLLNMHFCRHNSVE